MFPKIFQRGDIVIVERMSKKYDVAWLGKVLETDKKRTIVVTWIERVKGLQVWEEGTDTYTISKTKVMAKLRPGILKKIDGQYQVSDTLLQQINKLY